MTGVKPKACLIPAASTWHHCTISPPNPLLKTQKYWVMCTKTHFKMRECKLIYVFCFSQVWTLFYIDVSQRGFKDDLNQNEMGCLLKIYIPRCTPVLLSMWRVYSRKLFQTKNPGDVDANKSRENLIFFTFSVISDFLSRWCYRTIFFWISVITLFAVSIKISGKFCYFIVFSIW